MMIWHVKYTQSKPYNIFLKLDRARMHNALQFYKSHDMAPEEIMFRDIKAFLWLNFISFVVCYVPRSCNTVAHAMAALGAGQLVPRQVWQDEVLMGVSTIVAGRG
jgi:hypothetical protein